MKRFARTLAHEIAEVLVEHMVDQALVEVDQLIEGLLVLFENFMVPQLSRVDLWQFLRVFDVPARDNAISDDRRLLMDSHHL